MIHIKHEMQLSSICQYHEGYKYDGKAIYNILRNFNKVSHHKFMTGSISVIKR